MQRKKKLYKGRKKALNTFEYTFRENGLFKEQDPKCCYPTKCFKDFQSFMNR